MVFAAANAWGAWQLHQMEITFFVAVESSLTQDGPICKSNKFRYITLTAIFYRCPTVDLQSNCMNISILLILFRKWVSSVLMIMAYSECLALNDHQLLVIERSGQKRQCWVQWLGLLCQSLYGRFNCLPAISRILTVCKIGPINPRYNPSVKRLLIDFWLITLPLRIVLTGYVTFGPLIDGHTSLIFVSDNNFQPHQQTKFYLFIDRKTTLKFKVNYYR